MSILRRSAFMVLLAVLLGALLLGSGCVTEQPADAVPTTAVPASDTISNLTFSTIQMPPYNYQENGTLRGISIDLFELVTERMGEKVSRDRVQMDTPSMPAYLAKTNSLFFAFARTPDREKSFKYAGPIISYRTVLFARPECGAVINGPGDLKGYRIGVVSEIASARQLLDSGVNQSQLVYDTNATALVEKLRSGEIDLLGYPEDSGRYLIRQVTGNASSFVVVYTFPAIPTYYAFSRDVPDTTVQSFQEALDTIKNDKQSQGFSEYERILYRYLGAGCTEKSFSDTAVMDLVNTTAAAIEKNASDTFRRINAAEAPYRDPANPALYVFVFDTNVTIVGQADNVRQVGVNLRGKTDVTGKPFRDEIVNGALRNGSGWVEYVYSNPAEDGLYSKTTYYRMTLGSDNKTYIVGSGKYKACQT